MQDLKPRIIKYLQSNGATHRGKIITMAYENGYTMKEIEETLLDDNFIPDGPNVRLHDFAADVRWFDKEL